MSRRSLPVLASGPAAGAGAAKAGPALGGATSVRVAMITLGCDKNTVDSERILSGLLGAGVELVAAADDADVVVVNTCGFIEIAKQESIDTLLEAARLKESGRVRAVVGMGCLVQRYKSELEREMPEVDLFLGLTEVDRLVPELARQGLIAGDGPIMERPLRVLAAGGGPAHLAHLKISEGCDHGCAFCAIPLMRGKFRSTPLDVLVGEARELERRGVVELSIVSQDTTWYGRDWARALARGITPPVAGDPAGDFFLGRPFQGMPNAGHAVGGDARRTAFDARRTAFDARGAEGPVRGGPVRAMAAPAPAATSTATDAMATAAMAARLGRIGRTGALPLLLETLLAETAIPWLRLFYMYPSGITPELVALIAREARIVPYLDMPIQHGADAVLARMRRPERRATILERVRWLRDAVPALALRTTVIVGFPGETEDDFESLLRLLDEVRFDHVGAFAYSEEEDTPAATMSGAVPASVRRERLERLLDHQRAISLERNEARIGLQTTVLVDEVDGDGLAVGRAPWQAAEVDGVVQIEGAAGAADTAQTAGAAETAQPAGAAGLEPGRFVTVVITGAEDHDLTGRLLS
jgi:tRNA A37 methylthiotransferase MiaB